MMKEIQEKYKNDPQKVQQEMFKLYKEHGVNPLGGCWPMLLPMPVLFALFFVFQNTIELRGASFLWLPDLSRPDPIYIIPVIMGLSMWGLTKVGQVGMEPNPQMKMMLYIMPVMMTFLFLNFASGLNLYYTVMNIASLPQQWMLAREHPEQRAEVPEDAEVHERVGEAPMRQHGPDTDVLVHPRRDELDEVRRRHERAGVLENAVGQEQRRELLGAAPRRRPPAWKIGSPEAVSSA